MEKDFEPDEKDIELMREASKALNNLLDCPESINSAIVLLQDKDGLMTEIAIGYSGSIIESVNAFIKTMVDKHNNAQQN